MKRILTLSAMLLTLVAGASCKANNKSMEKQTGKQEKILFINGSPNRDGNTAALAKVLLEGKSYETLMLTDYRINVYGQTLDGDQFDEVLEKMREADIVVMGSGRGRRRVYEGERRKA